MTDGAALSPRFGRDSINRNAQADVSVTTIASSIRVAFCANGISEHGDRHRYLASNGSGRTKWFAKRMSP
jgi:hypothetical protein